MGGRPGVPGYFLPFFFFAALFFAPFFIPFFAAFFAAIGSLL
jgi:hypothetical protein